MKMKRVLGVTAVLLTIIICAAFSTKSIAGNNSNSSVLPEMYVDSTATSPLGTLVIRGSDSKKEISGTNVYYCDDGEAFLSYRRNDTYFTEDKTKWHIVSWKEKNVDGYKLDKNIGKGAMFVDFSYDGIDWIESDYYYSDLFGSEEDPEDFERFSQIDINEALYFRITVIYRLERTKEVIPGHWVNPFYYKQDEEVKEYANLNEKYVFRLGRSDCAVTFHNVSSNSIVNNNTDVTYGFYVNKNYSNSEVQVKKDNKSVYIVDDLETVSGKGKYLITVKDPLGAEFVYHINVTDGLTLKNLSPVVYQGDYNEQEKVDGNTVFGKKSLTTLKIAQNVDSSFSTGKYGTYSAYGVTGETFKIFLNIWDNYSSSSDEWYIENDTWGKKDKQKVAGISTEPVATGALFIQTSKDGINWNNADKNRYVNVLYTTDFYNYYWDRGDIEIYTPSGKDIGDGLYIRVLYAYMVQKDEKSSTNTRYLEKYEFYVCNDNLGSITIHNMSLSDTEIKKIFGDADDQTIEVGIHAETLTDGSETVTGFKLDTSLNQAAKVSVTLDGNPVDIPQDKIFTNSGKYEISISSPIGTTDHRTIYVDTADIDSVKERYFGDCFITGKRIFEEGLYPVYEGGKDTKWHIMEVSDNYLPLQGTITNITTGDSTRIEATRTEKSGSIISAGEYEAILFTNPEYDIDDQSGDIRRFTFHFRIIEEGTAPGPVVNKNSLENYSKSNVADVYPVYYGLTYSSASKGYITLLFATRESALDYAYNYEKGMVEEQEDGSYRYNGSFQVSQKELYESNWDLTDAMYYFAEQAVQELYIDLTDKFTYTTLPEDVLEETPNLRTLELNNSVYVFADGDQKAKLMDLDALPIINDKVYSIQYPDKDGRVEERKDEVADFEFVKDKYGCDSDSVSITDSEGNTFNIEYNKSEGEELKDLGCSNGVVTINESTIYGDTTSYQAVYIAEGYNTSEITIEYYLNGERLESTFSQNNLENDILAGAFGISSVVDKLDPYDLILVTMPDGNRKPYVADKVIKELWTDEGVYNIKIVNRLGYGYDFDVELTGSEVSIISFTGEGTEEIKDILVVAGQTDVPIPQPTKYGYDFEKYVDSDGNEYTDIIEIIDFDGKKELTPVYVPKTVKLTLMNPDGSMLQEISALFDSEIELPLPDLNDNEEFVCWKRESDGAELSMDYFVNIEEDQILKPSINIIEIEESEEANVQIDDNDIENYIVSEDDNQTNEIAEKSQDNKTIIIIAIIIIVFVVIFIASMIVVMSVKAATKNKRKKG